MYQFSICTNWLIIVAFKVHQLINMCTFQYWRHFWYLSMGNNRPTNRLIFIIFISLKLKSFQLTPPPKYRKWLSSLKLNPHYGPFYYNINSNGNLSQSLHYIVHPHYMDILWYLWHCSIECMEFHNIVITLAPGGTMCGCCMFCL